MTVTLALDFGTSNSAAAMLVDGRPLRLPVEHGADTLPTALFFVTGGPLLIGEAAGEALIAGEDGRYMRALKSVLGTPLLHEERTIGGRRRTLAAIVADFLSEVRRRAEAQAGTTFTRVLSGRPVHFHSADPARDARAEADLAACYRAAGFEEVAFLFEPEAAARAAHTLAQEGETGLIVDIGGGTSDFSVFRVEHGRPRILASHGIRLGGTDFDHAVSMTHAMPLLGLGGELRRTFGPGLLPVPVDLYADLATWAKIPFLYTPDTRALVAGMLRDAVTPETIARLHKVMVEELGHELAFAVERGKIAANGHAAACIDMGFIERGLAAPIDDGSLSRALAPFAARLHEAMEHTLTLADVAPPQIGTAIMVGGSSLMGLVADQVGRLCPSARIARSEAFTAVVDGLALATAD